MEQCISKVLCSAISAKLVDGNGVPLSQELVPRSTNGQCIRVLICLQCICRQAVLYLSADEFVNILDQTTAAGVLEICLNACTCDRLSPFADCPELLPKGDHFAGLACGPIVSAQCGNVLFNLNPSLGARQQLLTVSIPPLDAPDPRICLRPKDDPFRPVAMPALVQGSAAGDFMPVWSNDSQTIAFARAATGIIVTSPTGVGGLSPIPGSNAGDSTPCFTPMGDVVFTSPTGVLIGNPTLPALPVGGTVPGDILQSDSPQDRLAVKRLGVGLVVSSSPSASLFPMQDTTPMDFSARWSPTESGLIVFYRMGMGIFVSRPLAGTSPIQLTAGNDQEPEWCSDGERIVFQRQGAGLYEVRLSQPFAEVKVAGTQSGDVNASYSSDCRCIVFQRTGDAIYTVIPGRTPVIVPGTQGGLNPQWSPDGQSLLYATGNGVFVVDLGRAWNGLLSSDTAITYLKQ